MSDDVRDEMREDAPVRESVIAAARRMAAERAEALAILGGTARDQDDAAA